MAHKYADAMGSIADLLDAVAKEKRAEANTEAGGYTGSTTHPVKNVDDHTDDAQTGSRFSENTSDVKEDQGEASVDSTPEGAAADQDKVQTDIGITSKATGDDPSVEDDYKGGKDDPGSDHPARTDNDSLDGQKYAEFRKLCKLAEQHGKAFLAAVAADPALASSAKQAQQNSAGAPAPAPAAPAKQAATNFDIAGVLGDMPAEQQKTASLAVINLLQDVLDTADRRAVKTAQFYRQLAKAAEEGPSPSEGEESPAAEKKEEKSENPSEGGSDGASDAPAEGADAGGPPPAPGGDAGGGLGTDAIMQLLQGGDAMGGAGDMGADPLAAMGGGGAPPGGAPPAGGMGEGAMGGAGGAGGMTIEEILPLLLQSLQMPQEALQNKVAEYVAKQILAPQAAQKSASSRRPPKTAQDVQRMKQVAAALSEILGLRA